MLLLSSANSPAAVTPGDTHKPCMAAMSMPLGASQATRLYLAATDGSATCTGNTNDGYIDLQTVQIAIPTIMSLRRHCINPGSGASSHRYVFPVCIKYMPVLASAYSDTSSKGAQQLRFRKLECPLSTAHDDATRQVKCRKDKRA